MNLANLFQRFDSSECRFLQIFVAHEQAQCFTSRINFYDFPRSFVSPLFAGKGGKKVRYNRRKDAFGRSIDAVSKIRYADVARRLSLIQNGTRLTRSLNTHSSLTSRSFLISPGKGNNLLPTVPEFKSFASRCDIPDELKLEENVLEAGRLNELTRTSGFLSDPRFY